MLFRHSDDAVDEHIRIAHLVVLVASRETMGTLSLSIRVCARLSPFLGSAEYFHRMLKWSILSTNDRWSKL